MNFTGNILVQFNSKGEPRLVFLDAGIVYSSKTEAEHKNLVEICFAFMMVSNVRMYLHFYQIYIYSFLYI